MAFEDYIANNTKQKKKTLRVILAVTIATQQ
jgi:hypothetical protein